VPTTWKEKEDCQKILTPLELHQIAIGTTLFTTTVNTHRHILECFTILAVCMSVGSSVHLPVFLFVSRRITPVSTLSVFRNRLKTYLFSRSFPS